MKVEINKQAEITQTVPYFESGDILILNYDGATYTTLATESLDGDKNWALIELNGELKWIAPSTKPDLIADLQDKIDKGEMVITLVKHQVAVLTLNI